MTLQSNILVYPNLLSLIRNLEEAGPVPPFASSVAAGFAGAVAAAASHTFDTAKSRSECIVVPKVWVCPYFN